MVPRRRSLRPGRHETWESAANRGRISAIVWLESGGANMRQGEPEKYGRDIDGGMTERRGDSCERRWRGRQVPRRGALP